MAPKPDDGSGGSTTILPSYSQVLKEKVLRKIFSRDSFKMIIPYPLIDT